jgi:hypothetical protein
MIMFAVLQNEIKIFCGGINKRISLKILVFSDAIVDPTDAETTSCFMTGWPNQQLR